MAQKSLCQLESTDAAIDPPGPSPATRTVLSATRTPVSQWRARYTTPSGVGHVEDFTDYVDDLKIFVDQVVMARPHLHRFLMGHSMGGAIAGLYSQTYPNDFQGMILSAPMLEINGHGTPMWVGAAMAHLQCLLGRSDAFFPGQDDSNQKPPPTFETNGMTHSRIRWENRKNLPPDQLGPRIVGPSNRWLAESLETMSEILSHAGDVKVPVLLFQAGKDSTVNPGGQERFCAATTKCKKVLLPDAGHSIFAETDAIRTVIFQEIDSFIGTNASIGVDSSQVPTRQP